MAEVAEQSIEIQVRTALQHLWAELSEKLSDVIDPMIKYGGGDHHALSLLTAASAVIAAIEAEEQEAATTGPPPDLAGMKQDLARNLESMISEWAQIRRQRSDLLD